MTRTKKNRFDLIVSVLIIGVLFYVFLVGADSYRKAWQSRGGQEINVFFERSSCKYIDKGSEGGQFHICKLSDQSGVEQTQITLDGISYRLLAGKPIRARRYGDNSEHLAIVDLRVLLAQDLFVILVIGIVFVRLGFTLLRKLDLLKTASSSILAYSLAISYLVVVWAFLSLLVKG